MIQAAIRYVYIWVFSKDVCVVNVREENACEDSCNVGVRGELLEAGVVVVMVMWVWVLVWAWQPRIHRPSRANGGEAHTHIHTDTPW